MNYLTEFDVCIQVVMGKLPSKLHKNENNPNISLYPMYLPKFHKNVLKYYRLDLLKRNHHWLQLQLPDDFGIFCKPF